jgi:hypothetical protein
MHRNDVIGRLNNSVELLEAVQFDGKPRPSSRTAAQ